VPAQPERAQRRRVRLVLPQIAPRARALALELVGEHQLIREAAGHDHGAVGQRAQDGIEQTRFPRAV
jgi:hypothetical protein